MINVSRDTWLTLLLLLALVAVSGAATFWQLRGETDHPPLASFSTQPDGGRALWLWLEALGYRPHDTTPGTFAVPHDADLALILEPQLPGITEAEWTTLNRWVEEGGTLLLAGEGFGTATSMQYHGFDVTYVDEEEREVTPGSPFLTSPPVGPLENAQTGAVLSADREDYTTLLTAGDQPVMVSFTHGQGTILLSTLTYPFSNEGLKQSGNPALVLNMFSLAGETKQVWFDEWHHGRRGPPEDVIAGPGQWLRGTPAGRSLIYVAAILFVALLLRGRRFGPAVPMRETRRRRAPAEHVEAVANLKRRAGHRDAVMDDYRQALKRGLGQRYRLSSSLPDDEFVARLAEYRPELDRQALADLLARLRAARVNESGMVSLAQEVAKWLK